MTSIFTLCFPIFYAFNYNVCEFELIEIAKKKLREQKPLLHKCAFRCLRKASDLQTFSNSNIWVRNYLFLEKYISSREPFFTMSYTTNSLPLLITKWVFMLICILSNYHTCPVLLKQITCTNYRRFEHFSRLCFFSLFLDISFLRGYIHSNTQLHIT